MTKKALFFLLMFYLYLILSADFAEAQQAKSFVNAPAIAFQLFKGVFLVAIAAALLAFLNRLFRSPREYQYECQRALLSPAELSFYVLESAVGAEYRLFAKVRLADILRVKTGLAGAAWQTAFNRIQSKHVDFLACDPRTSAIIFAVELDDSSHLLAERRSRDKFVDRAFAEIGVPIFRFAARRGYSVQEIRKAIGEKLNRPAH
ncbi:MAG TPA: DUF2726 domain-containing protein, partial [Verrucomicrobiae bacterium]|nr:DUF2726 domain-containing protein [Verrucomicrobiae bacterium]